MLSLGGLQCYSYDSEGPFQYKIIQGIDFKDKKENEIYPIYAKALQNQNSEILSKIEDHFNKNLAFYFNFAADQLSAYIDLSYLEKFIVKHLSLFQESDLNPNLPIQFLYRLFCLIDQISPTEIQLSAVQLFLLTCTKKYGELIDFFIINDFPGQKNSLAEQPGLLSYIYSTDTKSGPRLIYPLDSDSTSISIDSGYVESSRYDTIKLIFTNDECIIPSKISGFDVISIPENGFAATRLDKIVFEKDSQITEIGSCAFEGSILTQLLELPSTLKTLAKNWCKGVPRLSKITISDNNKYFYMDHDSLMQYSSKSLLFHNRKATETEITIPSSVTTICENAFAYCNVKKIKFSTGQNQLKTIEHDAFAFSSLVELDLPSSLKTLSPNWCSSTDSLTIINLDPSNLSFKYENSLLFSHHMYTIIFAARDVNKISIPQSVSRIRENAFQNCKNLHTVNFVFNSDLQVIDHHAFSNCTRLSRIIIPSNVKQIGSSAFYGCSSLQEITFHGEQIEIGDHCFKNCSKLNNIVFLNAKKIVIKKDAFHKKFNDTEGKTNLKIFIKPWAEITGDGVPNIESYLHPLSNDKDYISNIYEDGTIPQTFEWGTMNLYRKQLQSDLSKKINIRCILDAESEALRIYGICDHLQNPIVSKLWCISRSPFTLYYEPMRNELSELISLSKIISIENAHDIVDQIFKIVIQLNELPITIPYLSIYDFMFYEYQNKFVVKLVNFGLYQIRNALYPELKSENKARMIRERLNYIDPEVLDGKKYKKEHYCYSIRKISEVFFPLMKLANTSSLENMYEEFKNYYYILSKPNRSA